MTTSHDATSSFNLQEWRARFVRIILQISAILGVVVLAAIFPITSQMEQILYSVLYLILLAAAFAPLPYSPRAYVFLIVLIAIGVEIVINRGAWGNGVLFLFSAILLASLLLDNRTDVAILVLLSAAYSIVAFLSLGEKLPIQSPTGAGLGIMGWLVFLIEFITLGIVIIVASVMLKNALAKTLRQNSESILTLEIEKKRLEERVQKRADEIEARISQLSASSSIAQIIAESQGQDDLLDNIARGIAEHFNYSHVGIFILDYQKRNIYLQTISAKADASMLGQIFRLSVDRRNPLNVAFEKNTSVLISGTEGINFSRDPNFPLARSRMIIPLSVRGNQIGALDVQSSRLSAFTQEDVRELEVLMNLAATTYGNIMLNAEVNRLEAQLNSSASFQTQQIWSKFTSRNKSAYQYTPAGVRPIFSREKRLESDALYVPVVLHDQRIGTIKLKKRKGDSEEWTARQRDLIEKISAQAALALENSRLVDEAQKSALRNQMIAAFSSRVRETLDIDSVVQSAATELRKVFDLKEAEVLIGSTLSIAPADDKG